jgi:hypothetical protein
MINNIFPFKTFRVKIAISTLLEILLLPITACAPQPTTIPAIVTVTSEPSVTETVQCVQEFVPPQITEIQPSAPIPGSEINVIGSGGYVQDTCGGYNEGSRVFKMYLDNEPVGDLSCYVNHCEGKLTLPGTLFIGSHCISVQTNECQFEFQIVAK